MDRILIILKKENGPRASSAPALGLNTIIFKHVYWYMQQTQVSVYRTIGPLVYIFNVYILYFAIVCALLVCLLILFETPVNMQFAGTFKLISKNVEIIIKKTNNLHRRKQSHRSAVQ